MKYYVKVTETEFYGFEVEADNKDEAFDKSLKLAQEMTDQQKEDWWFDSDGDVEVTDD